MSMFDNSENHEIVLPLPFDRAFDLIRSTAEKCGEIVDENRMLGMVRYKVKGSFIPLRNPAKVSINISSQEEGNCLVKIDVDSNDGVGAFRTSSHTYDAFMEELSAQTK